MSLDGPHYFHFQQNAFYFGSKCLYVVHIYRHGRPDGHQNFNFLFLLE